MLFFVLISCFAQIVITTPDDAYVFQATDLPSLPNGHLDERLLPSVGNGHLSTNVWSDSIFVNGLYNGRHGESYRARIPSFHSSEFEFENCANVTRLYQLNTKQGIMEETIRCGHLATLTYRTYAHASALGVLVTEIQLVRVTGSTGNVRVTRSDLSGNSTSEDFTWQLDQKGKKVGQTRTSETESSPRETVGIFYDAMNPFYELRNGEERREYVYILSVRKNVSLARISYNIAKNLKLEELRDSHICHWEKTWENGNVELEGSNMDKGLQDAVIGSLYYLYSSLPALFDCLHTSLSSKLKWESEPFYGISPGGLANGKAGKDYLGHVFWDQETWMWPAISVFRPDLAEKMLEYRIRRVGEARKHAAEGGYEGARFPWESASTGADVTPDPNCSQFEQHISGDIAFAFRSLVAQTGNIDWLGQSEAADTANDVIVDLAKFWISRSSFNQEKHRWDINNVMPPDEYAVNVNNSVVTNLLANYAVNTARWTTCLVTNQTTAAKIIPDDWLEQMKNVVFTYNRQKQYHEEFEGFDERMQSGTLSPRGVKQADAVLLNYPFNWKMPDRVLKNDLELYANITNVDGPAMTWSIFAINWLQLGELEKANMFFRKSYRPYIRGPFQIWTETRSGVGAVNFLTGSGGFLQSLINGYGGLRILPDRLEILDIKSLPPTVDRMTLKGLVYQGYHFNITFGSKTDNNTITLQCVQKGSEDLVIELDNGSTMDVDCTQPIVIPRQHVNMYRKNPSSCPPPKDLINMTYTDYPNIEISVV